MGQLFNAGANPRRLWKYLAANFDIFGGGVLWVVPVGRAVMNMKRKRSDPSAKVKDSAASKGVYKSRDTSHHRP